MLKKRTPRDYKFIRLLGEGSFSSVYLAVDANVGGAPRVPQNNQQQPPVSDGSTPVGNSLPLAADLQTEAICKQPIGPPKVRKYAIKVCQKFHIKRQGKQVAIMREKEIMNILNQSPNEHFIRLYCTFQDMERLFFVMSYAENGELLTYMLKHPLTVDAVRRFTLQLVDALEHLHKLDIVHRDLKPENILLGERLNLLISDFGSAQIYKKKSAPVQQTSGATTNTTANSSSPPPPTKPSQATSPTDAQNHREHETTASELSREAPASGDANTNNNTGDRRNSFVGTAQYVSPEMLTNRQASNKSDLWALGVIVYQMATNVMPFDAPNEYLIYKKIQSLDYKFPQDFEPNARNLVESLVKLIPSERLGAHDDLQIEGYTSIRAHPFLNGITDADPLETLDLTDGGTIEDPDLRNIDKIAPGLDESQMLRLLTDS